MAATQDAPQYQPLAQMLAELPRQCRLGTKKNLDAADGQIPISALLTSASAHDSQVAIPLMRMTSRRVVYLYELMDSAYDSDAIVAESRDLNHAPIVAPHPRRGTKRIS